MLYKCFVFGGNGLLESKPLLLFAFVIEGQYKLPFLSYNIAHVSLSVAKDVVT